MLIIEINSADGKFHRFQSQSHREECWIEGYIEVPKELEVKVFKNGGFCELIIENDILVDVISHPEWRPEEIKEPTALEQLRADIDYIAIMAEVKL